MIVDTSTIIAILRGEPDIEVYLHALAQAGEPLLYKGYDFTHTDVRSAL